MGVPAAHLRPVNQSTTSQWEILHTGRVTPYRTVVRHEMIKRKINRLGFQCACASAIFTTP